jgi:hypothetical protein
MAEIGDVDGDLHISSIMISNAMIFYKRQNLFFSAQHILPYVIFATLHNLLVRILCY